MNKNTKKVLSILQTMAPESVALIGLGNEDRADDGFGIMLASRIKDRFPDHVYSEKDRSVEGLVFDLLERPDIRNILFVDLADFGGSPGELSLFDGESAEQFIPVFSTHKVPIVFLIQMVIQQNKTPYILGVQPLSVTFIGTMSEPVALRLNELEEFFIGYWSGSRV